MDHAAVVFFPVVKFVDAVSESPKCQLDELSGSAPSAPVHLGSDFYSPEFMPTSFPVGLLIAENTIIAVMIQLLITQILFKNYCFPMIPKLTESRISELFHPPFAVASLSESSNARKYGASSGTA